MAGYNFSSDAFPNPARTRFAAATPPSSHTKIRVRVVRTKTAIRMLIAQAMQNFRARETQIFEQIAGVLGQPAAVRVQYSRIVISRVTHGSNIANAGSSALSFRVPGDFSLANQLGNHCRANRFGHRRELKNGVRVNRLFGVYIANAEAFRVHRVVLKHHCDRNSRHNVFLDLLLCEFFEFLNRVRHLLGCHLRFFLRVDAKRRPQNKR